MAWLQIATERGLDPYILYAVALVESARINDRLGTLALGTQQARPPHHSILPA